MIAPKENQNSPQIPRFEGNYEMFEKEFQIMNLRKLSDMQENRQTKQRNQKNNSGHE
jgi:hypothetical protein